MKPLEIKTTLFAIVLASLQLGAVEPVKTYTFADPCTPHVVMTVVADTYGCCTFTAFSSMIPGQAAGTYEWAFGDGKTGSGTITAHCYDPVTVTTVYTGTLTYANPTVCNPVSSSINFTITLPPVPSGSCVVAASEVLQAASSVSVLGGIAIPEQMRTIDFGEGGGYSNSTTHTYAGCGNFVITEKTWDMNFPDQVCYAYTGIHIQCKEMPTNVEEVRSQSARAYPNPCSDQLTVTSEKAIMRITITDLLGKQCAVISEAGENPILVPTFALLPGTYFAKIEYFNNTSDFVKIIRQ